jgi:glycosyltransferase involved in cell wall biosynthesis
VLHAHNLDSAGLLAQRIEREFGIPYLVTEHSTYYHRDLVPRELLPRLATAAQDASSFGAVSPELARLLRQKLSLGRLNIDILPNVIDPDFLTAAVAEQKSCRSDFSFLCIGNLIPVKNHEMLIKAFHSAFADSPGVALRIGGDGELRNVLGDLVQELGLSDRIEFVGRLGRPDVLREIDQCNAFVLPSRYETFGVVLIAAMARGKPVISTACGGPEAFVTKLDGVVVANEDQSAFALAMKTMVSRAGSYDAADIRLRAIDRFGPRALLARLEPMYRRAVS